VNSELEELPRQSPDPVIAGPEQLKRSIDSLQRLYTIVIGLAVTEALRGFLSPPALPVEPWWANWRPLAVLLLTVVPFYHGANGHLDQTYLYGFEGQRREKRYALLIDFAVLFLEGILFFALALSLSDFGRFVKEFQALLLLDVIWAVIVILTGPSSKDAAHAMKWAGLNLAAVVAVTFVQDTAILVAGSRPKWVLGIALLRTVADYGLCWNFYVARYPMMKSADRA
jgi:hypothetical protein